MTTDTIFSIYVRRGSAAYFGESVTMTEHGLQAAYFAQASDAPDALVVAALLHDIGHLIESVPDDIADWKTDACHELSGSRWLASRFGPEVCEPACACMCRRNAICVQQIRHTSAGSAPRPF